MGVFIAAGLIVSWQKLGRRTGPIVTMIAIDRMVLGLSIGSSAEK